MKKIFFLISIVLYSSIFVFAQNDSLTLVTAKWESRSLTPEVVWKKFHFNQDELFQSNQNIDILELAPRLHATKLTIAYSDSLETTSQIAKTKHAIAAINGSFFKMRGPDPDNHPDLTTVPRLSPSKIDRNRSIVFLKVNHKIITENEKEDSHVKRHPRGVLTINGKKISVLMADTTVKDWEKTLRARYVMTASPILLDSGVETTIPDDSFCTHRHPRTAVGVRADGSALLLVVDGRSPAANGMSIKELQKTMHWLGCIDAINLDGGGSSAMYIKGQPFNGIVNYPSDNKKFDHDGEREVANAILILAE